MQRAAAAGRGWRRTSGENRGDGPPRKVSSFFCSWFLFFLQLNHIICIPTPLSPNASPSPAMPSPSATGELGRLSCGHRRFGRHPPRRRARPALLRPSLSAAASAGELLRVRRSLELGRCLLCRLDRRRLPDVSSSAAECKLIFLFMVFIFFLQLNHIIFIPALNFAPPSPPIPRPSTSPQEPPLPSSRNATTRPASSSRPIPRRWGSPNRPSCDDALRRPPPGSLFPTMPCDDRRAARSNAEEVSLYYVLFFIMCNIF